MHQEFQSMADLGLNSSLTSQKLASNLNMINLSSASKLRTLSDGFHDEAQSIYDSASSVLDNMYVKTANTTFLESMGYQEGIYRIKEPKIRLQSTDQIAYMYIDTNHLFNNALNYTGQFVNQGDIFDIPSQGIRLIILETIGATNLVADEKIYISADIKSYGDNTFSMTAGGDISITNIPGQLASICSAITFGLTKDISIPIILEDINNFRSRVTLAKNTSKYGTEGAIRLAISSNPLVTDYIINYNTYPYEVIVFNSNMLFDNTYNDYLEKYAIPAVETQTLLRKSVGSSFTIKTPTAISFFLQLVDVNNNVQPLLMNDFRTFLSTIYVLGTQLLLTKDILAPYFVSTGFTSDQLNGLTMKIYKYYNGFSYLSSDPFVLIGADEYPFVIVGATP
jgi:hypothetical protein